MLNAGRDFYRCNTDRACPNQVREAKLAKPEPTSAVIVDVRVIEKGFAALPTDAEHGRGSIIVVPYHLE
uniref:Uncharacterized protein n=1 Tax=Anopheles stephensi TaxID=30069 RepID=A0A182YQ75_ANOST